MVAPLLYPRHGRLTSESPGDSTPASQVSICDDTMRMKFLFVPAVLLLVIGGGWNFICKVKVGDEGMMMAIRFFEETGGREWRGRLKTEVKMATQQCSYARLRHG